MLLGISLGIRKKKTPHKTGYQSDCSDEEWAFVAPHLTLMKEDAPQREHPLRKVFDALRYMVRAGCPWRMIPNDLPPWHAVYDQAQRWLAAGVFEAIAHDLRKMLRLLAERAVQPSAAIIDGRTVQSTPESGGRAGYDGYKRRKGSKVHAAVDTLGHLLALKVTPANQSKRDPVGELAKEVQAATGDAVEIFWSSNSLKPSAASCSCPDVGSSNAPSPGPPAPDVWRGTTNASRKPSPVSIGSPISP